MKPNEYQGFINTLNMFRATAAMYALNIFRKKSGDKYLGEILDWDTPTNLEERFTIGKKSFFIDNGFFQYEKIENPIAENIGTINMVIRFDYDKTHVILSLTSYKATDADDFEPCEEKDTDEIYKLIEGLEKRIGELAEEHKQLKTKISVIEQNREHKVIPHNAPAYLYFGPNDKVGLRGPFGDNIQYASYKLSQTATGCSQ